MAAWTRLTIAAAIATGCFALSVAGAAAETGIEVVMNQAKIVKLKSFDISEILHSTGYSTSVNFYGGRSDDAEPSGKPLHCA